MIATIKILIAEAGENDILSQYIIFCKVVDNLVMEKGRSLATMREAIQICKDRNVLREYLSRHEKEAIDVLMDLYDQERITDRMLASTRKETKIEDIKSLMTNLKMTAEQAMQALGIPAADQSKYQAML